MYQRHGRRISDDWLRNIGYPNKSNSLNFTSWAICKDDLSVLFVLVFIGIQLLSIYKNWNSAILVCNGFLFINFYN